MPQLLEPGSPVLRFFNTLADLCWTSLLWVVFSLPLVTMGASTAALYQLVFHTMEDRDDTMHAFFRGFRQNFKQATLAWLLILALGAALFFSGQMLPIVEPAAVRQVLQILRLLVVLASALGAIYLLPLVSYFENTIYGHLKNGLLLGILSPGRSVLLLLLHGTPLWVLLLSQPLFLAMAPIWALFWPGLLIRLSARIIHPIFQKFGPSI